MMITWKVDCDIPACAFKTKMDVILTGRSYQAYGEEFPLLDSKYSDDTAVLFDLREHLADGVYSIMSHFTRFGMEVHSGKIEPREDRKSYLFQRFRQL